MYGELKSSISSLKMMPVDWDMTLEPKLKMGNDRSYVSYECYLTVKWKQKILSKTIGKQRVFRVHVCYINDLSLDIYNLPCGIMYSSVLLSQRRSCLVGLLLIIDCAGGSHSTSILSYDGQVCCPMIVFDKIIWLVVTVWLSGVICDLAPDPVSKVVWGHVVDELERR